MGKLFIAHCQSSLEDNSPILLFFTDLICKTCFLFLLLFNSFINFSNSWSWVLRNNFNFIEMFFNSSVCINPNNSFFNFSFLFDVGMWVCFRCELGEQGEVICHLMFLIWFDVGLVLMFFVFLLWVRAWTWTGRTCVKCSRVTVFGFNCGFLLIIYGLWSGEFVFSTVVF